MNIFSEYALPIKSLRKLYPFDVDSWADSIEYCCCEWRQTSTNLISDNIVLFYTNISQVVFDVFRCASQIGI